MKSHLAVKVAGKEMALRPDQTLDIELANPLFNNTEMFSLPFNPPFEKNRHLMKNIDDVKSDVSPMTMEDWSKRIDAYLNTSETRLYMILRNGQYAVIKLDDPDNGTVVQTYFEEGVEDSAAFIGTEGSFSN